ncbi:hypothetical protein [Nocardioides convexus]|uniref:hypothetical protein n=1 Tax=Nocardioides convexus TaxID=2712224 RepID=UPI00241852D6|nr:hypothetical protein [Nocardioides convexus]
MSTPTQRAEFVERLGGALTSAGLARLPSRVFAALLVDDDGRMTAAEPDDDAGRQSGRDLRRHALPRRRRHGAARAGARLAARHLRGRGRRLARHDDPRRPGSTHR